MTATAASSYPASFSLEPPDRIANWRPLVHWLMAIPHMVVLYALGIVSEVVAVVSWFAILFTGKQPEGLAGVQSMYLRYSMRVFAFVGFQVEEYPPFAFGSSASDPGDGGRVRVDFRPALENRNRVTVFFRLLLLIPHMIVLGLVGMVAGLAYVVGFFAVLFTGRWPAGLRRFVLGVMRWGLRTQAYMLLLTDEYPPFSLD